MPDKSQNPLKSLYNEAYVASFELTQSPLRISGLINYMELDCSQDVVDFACGSGMLTPHIAPLVKSYTGVDFSEPFIRTANQKKETLSVTNVEFVCSEITDFCRERKNRYNTGFALDFAEHVYDKEWLEILRSIRTSIKSGGTLYLHTPNGDFIVEKMKKRNFLLKQIHDHVAVRTPGENIRLLEQAGYQNIHIKFIPHYCILKILHPLSCLPFIGKYFKARLFIEATA